ncbi:hypothetical protein CHUAL_012419 [Chamberlinius hualienensis]
MDAHSLNRAVLAFSHRNTWFGGIINCSDNEYEEDNNNDGRLKIKIDPGCFRACKSFSLPHRWRLNNNNNNNHILLDWKAQKQSNTNGVELESQITKAEPRRSSFVNPNEFNRRRKLILAWFNEFDNEQKNLILKELLKHCGTSQNHQLSVALQPVMHQFCPDNCCDLLSWLPNSLALHVLSFLDPVSLCRCALVCRNWKVLAENERLWQRLCQYCSPQWKLSPSAEQRQLQRLRLTDEKTMWKKAFSERHRLARNWMTGQCHVRTFEGHTQGISCVQFDNMRIVSGSSDKTIKMWDIRTNSPWAVLTLVGHSGTVRCLHLEGNRLVSGSTDCTIKVWDLSSNSSWCSIACKVTMIGHRDTVRCLQVHMDKVVSGSYDKTLKLWNLSTGECMLTLTGHEGGVLCVQQDDTKIVSGSADKTIKIWQVSDGLCLNTLYGHQGAVTCLQFDSHRVVSGSLDCTIKFWNLKSGHCLSTLDWMKSEGHTGVIRCLRADSWRIVSAGDDKTLKVWSLESGQRLVTLRNHTDGVTCLQFNDHVIVSGSYDKTVKLWDFGVC